MIPSGGSARFQYNAVDSNGKTDGDEILVMIKAVHCPVGEDPRTVDPEIGVSCFPKDKIIVSVLLDPYLAVEIIQGINGISVKGVNIDHAHAVRRDPVP